MPVHRTDECVRKHVPVNASLLCSSDERTEKIVKNLGPTGNRTTVVAGFRRFHGVVVCRKGWDTGCPTVAHSMPPGACEERCRLESQDEAYYRHSPVSNR